MCGPLPPITLPDGIKWFIVIMQMVACDSEEYIGAESCESCPANSGCNSTGTQWKECQNITDCVCDTDYSMAATAGGSYHCKLTLHSKQWHVSEGMVGLGRSS